MTSSRFPGVYENDSTYTGDVPSIRKVKYLHDFFDRKLDKQDKPNTVYYVNAEGKQEMLPIDKIVQKSVNEILKKDAPADGKQYVRQDHEWEEGISAIVEDYTKGDDGVYDGGGALLGVADLIIDGGTSKAIK
jgi:hypothetical protein